MERKLTAILSADVKGYSRLMGDDEEATIRTLTTYREVMTTLIQQHRGRVVDSPGDNMLAEFASAVDAVRSAVEIQRELRVKNADLPDARKMEFRIGINVGDVIAEGERIYGDGVNIAARIEGLTDPGGICISGTVYDQIENKLTLHYEYIGEQEVKNIAKPVRVWRILGEASKSQSSQSPSNLAQAADPKGQLDKAKRQWVGTTSLFRAAAIVAGVLLVGGIATFRFSSLFPLRTQNEAVAAFPPLPDKPSVAVLPFVNMTEDPRQEFLSDGIAEGVMTGLCKLPSVFVISRESASTYKGKAVTVREISRGLGVRYVLEGSIQKAAHDHIRITAQLIDGTTDQQVWAEQYDRPAQDLFAVRDDITRKLVVHIAPKMTPVEQSRLERAYAGNLEAYEYYLRGTVTWQQGGDPESNVQGRQACEKAIELDPNYAAAYACIGYTYFFDWLNAWTQDPQVLENMLAVAQKALKIDDSLPPAHELVGLHRFVHRQYEQAIAEFERAIELGPNWSSTYSALGGTLNAIGRSEEAIPLLEKAVRYEARYPFWTANYLTGLGDSYRLLGQYDKAIEAFKKSINTYPTPGAALWLTATYSESGQDALAQATAEQFQKAIPQFSLDILQPRILYQDPAKTERLFAALRKAGLK
jgi:adenylate cyclase